MNFHTISLAKLSKQYAQFSALSSVNLELKAGEVHALMGENGAGKSTLIKLIAGVTPAASMDIAIDGKPVQVISPADAYAAGFRFIHQELNIVSSLSVAENILLGRDVPTRLGCLIDWRSLHRQASAALAQLDIRHIDVSVQAGRLGIGDRMLVRIASALVAEGHQQGILFVLDEPTAALTSAESEKLFAVIANLCQRGAAILYVSHRMGEVMRLADRVTVLRDGKVVLAVARSATTASALIHAMTGRDRLDVYPPPLAPPQRAVACSVDQVSTRHLTGLDVSVRKGEILGLAGLAESGQTEFLRMFMGLEPMHCGNLLFNGSTAPSTPHAAWQAGVAYVPRERRSQGLILTRSISDNVSLPHLTDTGVFVSRRGENARIGRLAGTVQLKANHMRQSVQQLSGGNQQKVMFARALYGKPSLLLLDEPTRGVDIAARFDIYELVRQLSIDGCAVIIASSDLPELLGMCDRILVLHKGRQVTLVETVDITAASLLEKINAGG